MKYLNRLTFFFLFLLMPFLVFSQRINNPKKNIKYTSGIAVQSIIVNENLTAQQLIEDVLINSSCANVSNFSITGGNFGSGELSYGSFDSNGTIFPFQSGLILTNGKSSSASLPRGTTASDGDNSWQGDNDLNHALNISSRNATILEFDFVPLGSKISFEYIFASEEYEESVGYTCQFSDAFVFLLKETGTTNYQNLALIPNTNIPVKVTTVHPAISGSQNSCGPQNEQYFDAFNNINYPTVYDGQTVILKAEATVIPNRQYHIKLVIGDDNDNEYDSAIFLAAGSFNLGYDLGDDRTISNGNPICSATFLDATDSNATDYQWLFNGNPLAGETNALLNFTPPFDNVTQSGNYSVEIEFGPTCKTISNEILVEFAEDLNLNISDFTKCDADNNQDGLTSFTQADFDIIKNQLFTNLPSNYQIKFYKDQEATSTPINIPYTNSIPGQETIYARISNINSACYPNYPINLNVNTFEKLDELETLFLCEPNEIFILSPNNSYLSYSWNTSTQQNTQSITVADPGIYIVTLENANHCYGTQTFTVERSELATITNILIDDFAENNSATIIATGTGVYEYSLDGINYQDENVFNNLEAGEYTVFVQDTKGCGITSKTFYVLDCPKFFTPNNDGYNDTWQIKNLDKRGFEASKIYIFDRYGKLLKQIAPLGNGWDGIFNNTRLPSTDYWFVLELTNGKTVKGYFALIR